MNKQYHILNGDSLLQQFPKSIQGKIIVARECLVDGNVKGNTLTDFFKVRAKFISNNYKGCTIEDYFENTVPEIQKIQQIPDHADINLWFEDDLFCQVNLWFVLNLVMKSNRIKQLFLIRPKTHNQYGFGGLSKSELISIFKNRLKLTQLHTLSLLWDFYQTNDTAQLMETAKRLKKLYPFIETAVKAHQQRIPTHGNLGRPIQSLIKIMNELNTTEFEPLFKEFCKREYIYGFGDLQVKKLLDEIKNNRKK